MQAHAEQCFAVSGFPLPDSFQQLLYETTVSGAASVAYWNSRLRQFTTAPKAPRPGSGRSRGMASVEAGQPVVQGGYTV